ncbi:DUF4135 domain-containing protein [Spongorhabdus nitratireducens]
MRQMYAPALFPVTGRAHTLSQDIGLKQLKNVMLSEHGPWDSIICSSDASREVLEKMTSAVEQHYKGRVQWQGRLDRLPLGVNQIEQSDRKQARKELGIADDCFVMLGLGRFSAVDKMDLHPLLLAVRELVLGSDRDISLYLAGAGNPCSNYIGSLLSSSYELLIDSCVHFELDIDDARKSLLLAAADVFISVSDSYQESFGIAPVEAMMAGLPVVLSEWNGYRELICNGVEGYLVPASRFGSVSKAVKPYAAARDSLVQAQTTAIDVGSLVETLKELSGNKKLCQKMGQAARNKAIERFEWSKLTLQYDALIERLSRLAREHSNWKSGFSNLYAQDDFFSHYVTKLQSDNQLYTLTDRGLRVLLGAEKLLASDEVAEAMPLQDAHLVLQYAGNLGRPLSVAELSPGLILEPSRSRAAVIWMLKYHLLACATEKKDERFVSGRVINLLPKIARRAEKIRKQKRYSSLIALLECDVLNEGVDSTATANIVLSVGTLLMDQLDGRLKKVKTAGLIVDLMHPFANWLKTVKWEQVSMNAAYARHLFRVARQWVHAAETFVERLSRDLCDLCLWINIKPDNLQSIQLQVMPEVEYFDVVKITFNGAHSIVYKDRDLSVENALLAPEKGLIDQLNKWNRSVLLKTVSCLCCSDQVDRNYGYMTWIDSDRSTKQRSGSWYKGMGALSALALQLGIKDLHENNMLVSDGLPCLIDAELMFSEDVISRLQQEISGNRAVTVDDLDISSLGKTNILDSDWAPVGITSKQVDLVREGFLIVFDLFRSHHKEIMEWKKSLAGLFVRFCEIPRVYQEEHLQKISEAHKLPIESDQIRRLGQWLAATGLREQYCALSEEKRFTPEKRILERYHHQWLKGRVVNQSRIVGELCQPAYLPHALDVDMDWEKLQTDLFSAEGKKAITLLTESYTHWLRTK